MINSWIKSDVQHPLVNDRGFSDVVLVTNCKGFFTFASYGHKEWHIAYGTSISTKGTEWQHLNYIEDE